MTFIVYSYFLDTCRAQLNIIAVRSFTGVLVLAGIDLIFFLVAGAVLGFGFVLETVLIMQGCFRYC